MTRTMRHMTGILIAVALAAVVSSCSDVGIGFETLPGAGADKEYIPRTGNNTYRNVFLVYSMGFNNLTGYLKEDIEDIMYNNAANLVEEARKSIYG